MRALNDFLERNRVVRARLILVTIAAIIVAGGLDLWQLYRAWH